MEANTKSLSDTVNAALAASALPLPADTHEQALGLTEVLGAICGLAGEDVAFAFKPNHAETTQSLLDFAGQLRLYREQRQQLTVPFHSDAELEVDCATLLSDWEAAAEKFWFLETMARRKVVRELAEAGGTSSQPDPEYDLPALEALAAIRAKLIAIGPDLAGISGFSGLTTDPDRLEPLARSASKLRSLIARHASDISEYATLSAAIRALVVDANDMLAEGGAIASALSLIHI